MIVDLDGFIAAQRQVWEELEALLDRLERDVAARLRLEEVQHLHLLYQRTASDLARIGPLAVDPELHAYLEGLVARAYGEIHGGRRQPFAFTPLRWFVARFPRAVRRHAAPLKLAVAATLLGCLFGGALLTWEPEAKEVLLPFQHLLGDPSERVAQEEARAAGVVAGGQERGTGQRVTFSSYLMTHNTRVAVFCFALGLTFGLGTLVLLFYNGVILGAITLDYLRAGEGVFLTGWLLPHGSVEIPAFLLAGQAGLVLAATLLGRAGGEPLGRRLRAVAPDLATLVGGVAVLLVWAGLIESFISQHHEPVLPYSLKIGFGAVQLGLLALLLLRGGRKGEPEHG